MSISRRHAIGLIGSVVCIAGFAPRAEAAPARLVPIKDPVTITFGGPRAKARSNGGYFCAGPGYNSIYISSYNSASEPERGYQRLLFPGVIGNALDFVTFASGAGLAFFGGVLDAAPGQEGAFVIPFNDAAYVTGPEARLSAAANERIFKISACRLTDGRALVAWRDGRYSDDYVNVRYRIVGEDGAPRSEIRTIRRTSGRAGHTLLAVAALPGGESMIAYFRHGASTLKLRCPVTPIGIDRFRSKSTARSTSSTLRTRKLTRPPRLLTSPTAIAPPSARRSSESASSSILSMLARARPSAFASSRM